MEVVANLAQQRVCSQRSVRSRQSRFPAVSSSSGATIHLMCAPHKPSGGTVHSGLTIVWKSEGDVTSAEVTAEMGADLNGSCCIWVTEGTSLGGRKRPQLPDSSGAQCSPAALPRLHKLSGDSQLFSPLQPRPELEEEAALPRCSMESTKLLLSSKGCFLPRADSPAQSEPVACSTGPLSCKTRAY